MSFPPIIPHPHCISSFQPERAALPRPCPSSSMPNDAIQFRGAQPKVEGPGPRTIQSNLKALIRWDKRHFRWSEGVDSQSWPFSFSFQKALPGNQQSMARAQFCPLGSSELLQLLLFSGSNRLGLPRPMKVMWPSCEQAGSSDRGSQK